MDPIEIGVLFLIVAVVLYVGFLFLKNNFLIYYFPSLFTNSPKSEANDPPAASESEPMESEETAAPPQTKSGSYVHKIYAGLFVIGIAAAIHLGPEGLNSLINNPPVIVSIENVEISTYVNTMDRAPVSFDVVLRNKSEDVVQVGSLEIKGEPEPLSGTVVVNQTMNAGEELTVPIEKQGVIPNSIIRHNQLKPSSLKIKVVVYDQAGKQINWTKEQIQYK